MSQVQPGDVESTCAIEKGWVAFTGYVEGVPSWQALATAPAIEMRASSPNFFGANIAGGRE